MTEIHSKLTGKALERNIIACILNNPDMQDQLHIPPAAFEDDSLRCVYTVLCELREAGHQNVTTATLRTFFDQREDFQQTLREHGGWTFLEGVSAKPDFDNFKFHCEELEGRHKLREIKARADAALQEIMGTPLESANQVFDILDKHLSGDGVLAENEVFTNDEFTTEWLDIQAQRYLAGDFQQNGIKVLNEHMRRLLGEQLIPGSLITLAGETNVGKSQWCQLLLRHFTHHQGIPTLVLDNELSKKEFSYRSLSNLSSVKMGNILNGSAFDPSSRDYLDIQKAVGEFKKAPIVWRKMLDMSIERVEKAVRSFLRKYPTSDFKHKILVVDGIKLQTGNDSFIEVGFFAQRLKMLAQKYEADGLVIFATCQLNRTGTARNTQKEKEAHPDHNQIGLSSMISNNSDDVIILTKHPEIDGSGQKTFSKFHRRLICTKARNHATFDGSNYVLMDFDGHRCYLEPAQSVGPDVETQMPSVGTNQPMF